MSRVRVIGWMVQPVVMADDGEHLTQLQVQPVMIPAAAWDAFKAGGDQAALHDIAAQLAAGGVGVGVGGGG